MLKKIILGVSIFFITVYVLFLVLPFFLNGIVNSYSDDISKIVEESSGFKVKLEDIRILTTPKLTAGIGVRHVEAALPTGETFLNVDFVQGKMSLLPLLLRKIEFDIVSADNLNVNLKIKKDGKFLLEDYIVQTTTEQKPEETQEPFVLPLGIKLSNHLPDIAAKNYNISLIDAQTDKAYSIYGEKFAVSDFILNKKIKINALGTVMFQDREQFHYDVKVLNKVMPDIDINDLLNPTEEVEKAASEPVDINILDIFKALYNNYLTADLVANITTDGTFEDVKLNGDLQVSNLGISVDGAKLPASNIDLKFKNNKINMYTKLYSAQNDLTELVGNFKTGKHPSIDLNFKSNAGFKGLIDIVDSVAKSFGYKELDSLTATGRIDADFNIKSNLKKVESSGYIKVPSASLLYRAQNISINDIKANIDLSNNMVSIKDTGLSVLNQPLSIKGTIGQDAVADISILANRLQLKSLLLAAGQMALLKENAVNSGTLSMDIDLKGKLDKIVPKIDISIDNVNVKNIPSNTALTVQNSTVNLLTDGKQAGGLLKVNNAKVINPALTLSAPEANLTFGEKDIDINKTYVLLEGSRIDITGKIYDYLSQTVKMDILAKGIGQICLKGSIADIYKTQKLDLNLYSTEQVSMAIPGFKNSNIKTNFNLKIGGVAVNPTLNGTVSVPSISIPDMLLTITDLKASLNGPIVNGKGTVSKFASGTIVAETLSSDFNLKDNIFYLRNLTGKAFDGKVGGNISYNIENGHIGVKFNGTDMNAEKAIAGAAGIKNALSGKLKFDADVTLHGTTDIEMMKNLKGKASFEISDGQLGNIGRFENFLFADNISSNSVMKAAVNSISVLPAVKNTAEFKYISGNLNFNNGWANLNPVKTSGPSMAYYVTGKYNLLNATANVVVLGRLSAEVVKLLGPVGELSVDKLTSFIPKFGQATAKIINAMTTDPKGENIAAIPALSSGNKNYKDFKVQFNGGVESRSSVKSFKWLSKCDTSAIETVNVKEQVQETKQAVQQAIQDKKNAINTRLEEQRKAAEEAKQQMQDAKEGLKNLKNLLK